MSSARPFTLDLTSGVTLRGIARLPEEAGPRPAIVVCHGFKGFMEWGFFPYLAELLADRGFTVLQFNFSGSGMKPGDERVTDLEAFRQNTLTRELDELLSIVEAAGADIAPGRVERDRLGLFGHSRGGGISLLASAREELRDRVRALVTWSAVGDFDRFSDEEKREWRRRGELIVVNARTGQELPVGLAALQDFEDHRQQLDLRAAAARRRVPWLIVHGEEDETVPVEEAKQLHASASEPQELLLIAEADHTFGAKHPFSGPTRELTRAMNATQAWFRKHLSPG